MDLRDYQIDIASKALSILQQLKIVYISAEVRCGKTLMALETAKLYGAKNVLFLTKKKAISSIQNDYKNFGYAYNLTVINNESMHTIQGEYDLLIHDESHRFGSYPKPSKMAKECKKLFGNLPLIMLSGTATPESYSQFYHQFWISNYSPFKQYSTFYKWAKEFVSISQVNFGYGFVNNYDNADYDKIMPFLKPYIISFTQQEAGFTSKVNETILEVEMKPKTYEMIERLKKDKLIQGKEELILGDTAVKLMNKIHQMSSGTIKFESGNSMCFDSSKADFIKEKFANEKIGIFYKFKAELDLLQNTFGDNLTTDLNEFNSTNKNIALQIVSGREGISLSKAKYLVYFSIDFSATSYFQSRDRLTTKDRLSNDIFWIFAKNSIEKKIYKAVMNKKNYTLSHFKKDLVL